MENIESLMGKSDMLALGKLLNSCLRDKVAIAEIGSYEGGSTLTLTKESIRYDGVVVAIDIWEDEAVCTRFWENLGGFIKLGYILPIRKPSVDACRLFADKLFDMVFIDADHKYSSVKQDIGAWLPKVRSNGLLCGYDCEGYYSKYSKAKQKEIDAKDNGVMKALYEIFGDGYKIAPQSRIWYVAV